MHLKHLRKPIGILALAVALSVATVINADNLGKIIGALEFPAITAASAFMQGGQ